MKKWKIISEEDISPSKWFPLFKQSVEIHNGKIIDDFYVSKLGDVSMVIAITKEKKLLLVKQYKHGYGDFTLEFPAGRIQTASTPLDGAKAELKEETGFTAKTYIELGYVVPLPTKDPSRIYGFIATDLTDTNEKQLDVTEMTEVVYLSVEEIDYKINNGEIIGSDTISFYYKAKLKFPELF